MAVITVFAGVLALLQGLAGLAGAILILLCVDFPEILAPVPVPEKWDSNATVATTLETTTMSTEQVNATEPIIKVEVKPIKIMADGYSTDPNRELIFCFAITCSVFNLIWIVSSILVFLGNEWRNSRLLWQWILATLAAVFTDFVGAIYFAAKLGDHVTSFDNSQEYRLVSSTFTFLKYIYPLILFIVFGRGFITIPINLLLAMLVNRTAHRYEKESNKREDITQSVLKNQTPVIPVIQTKNGAITEAHNSSPSGVYSNQCFTLDEKY